MVAAAAKVRKEKEVFFRQGEDGERAREWGGGWTREIIGSDGGGEGLGKQGLQGGGGRRLKARVWNGGVYRRRHVQLHACGYSRWIFAGYAAMVQADEREREREETLLGNSV